MAKRKCQTKLQDQDLYDEPKRRRRCLTIDEKINLLDRLTAGQKASELSRKFNVSESGIRALPKLEKQIRNYAAQCSAGICKSTSYIPRCLIVEQTEQQLHRWYVEQLAKGSTMLTMTSICKKAREMYLTLKEQETKQAKPVNDVDGDDATDYDFKASKGWFVKFRKRYNLNFKSANESIVSDTEAAQKYPAHFKTIVQKGNYTPQQVFAATQFALDWKRIPDTALRNGPHNKISCDRLSMLLCGNASGDYEVKPLLVYRNFAPFSLRDRNLDELPVFWRARPRSSQKSPTVTPKLFHEWLTQCFIPSVCDYLLIMELPKRCMLVLDAELLHKTALPPYDDSFVQLEFLPPNTGSILQPISLSVVPIFKCNYLRCLLTHLLKRNNPEQNLSKTWRNLVIAEGIDLINTSLEELTADNWNGGWVHLWMEIVRKPLNSSDLNYECQRIVEIAHHLPGADSSKLSVEDILHHLGMKNNDNDQNQATMESQVENMSENILTNSTVTVDSDGDNEEDNYIEDCEDEAYDEEVYILSSSKVSSIIKETENIIDCANNDTSADKIRCTTQPMGIEVVKRQAGGKSLDLNNENTIKIQNINTALKLSQQLISILAKVSNSQEHLQLIDSLNILLQPYRNLKEHLQQPSILKYFKKS